MNLFFKTVFSLTLLFSFKAQSNIDFRSENDLSPSDYLMGSHGIGSDPVFDKYRTIDLSLDIGVSSDCGQIDVKSTLRAALKNVLDAKYLKDMGKNIKGETTCRCIPNAFNLLLFSHLVQYFKTQQNQSQRSCSTEA